MCYKSACATTVCRLADPTTGSACRQATAQCMRAERACRLFGLQASGGVVRPTTSETAPVGRQPRSACVLCGLAYAVDRRRAVARRTRSFAYCSDVFRHIKSVKSTSLVLRRFQSKGEPKGSRRKRGHGTQRDGTTRIFRLFKLSNCHNSLGRRHRGDRQPVHGFHC